MASAQEPGTLYFVAKAPDGREVPITSMDTSIAAPGGSPDGVKASTANADNQLFLAAVGPWIPKNWTLMVKTVTIGTDGIDVSDNFVSLPYTTKSGVRYLNRSSFTNPTPADYTSTAGIEQVWGGYLVVEDMIRLGGGFVFFSLEDDTA